MEPTLNKPRMAVAITLLAIMLSGLVFWYTTTRFAMQGWEDVIFNYLIALFIGECGAGIVLYLTAFTMNGTLPKWFWETV